MKCTPHTIAEKNLFFAIPIYQRLFEWDSENIDTLMEDLMKEYVNTEGKGDYYIGMLTSTKDNELVDGQQRFTVMMLLGCVLQGVCEEWKKFLAADNRPRLGFTSRPLDNAYLKSLMEREKDENRSFRNLKMRNGFDRISMFMDKVEDKKRRSFASYIYHHLSFFISNLPEKYSPSDLNKYFERMNTTGKNLEQHEILKVKLLGNLDVDIDRYMWLWNKLADVDTLLIRRRKDVNIEELKRRALSSNIETVVSGNLIDGLKCAAAADGDEEPVSIGAIEPSASKPKKEHVLNKESRCALTFPYLLLQVLYRKIGKKPEGSINDFFNPGNLLTVFEKHLPFSGSRVDKDAIKDFMEKLLKARLALDICFVRPTEYGYFLDMNLDEDNPALRNLMMLQSMWYVSSSNYTHYRWFNRMMDEVDKYGLPDADSLYKSFKSSIDKEFPLPPYEALSFGGDIRFWFWKLDFHIWKHRNELFEKGTPEMEIVENYIFKRNRSIEHIAPRTPQSNSAMKWDDTEGDKTLRDSFGNLVMISQGLNSSLSNESYEVKMAHVRAYCNGSKSGSVESLKLLMAHQDYPDGWTRDTIKEHGKLMYELLRHTFD